MAAIILIVCSNDTLHLLSLLWLSILIPQLFTMYTYILRRKLHTFNTLSNEVNSGRIIIVIIVALNSASLSLCANLMNSANTKTKRNGMKLKESEQNSRKYYHKNDLNTIVVAIIHHSKKYKIFPRNFITAVV